jgi:hypothetical protein
MNTLRLARGFALVAILGVASVVANHAQESVVTQPTGNVTVVNGCQFERAALNIMLSFDAANTIAGMNITPRTPPAVTSAVPASNRFTEEPINTI